MNTPDLPVHYVCTHDKAKDIIAAHDRFWVSDCGCRDVCPEDSIKMVERAGHAGG